MKPLDEPRRRRRRVVRAHRGGGVGGDLSKLCPIKAFLQCTFLLLIWIWIAMSISIVAYKVLWPSSSFHNDELSSGSNNNSDSGGEKGGVGSGGYLRGGRRKDLVWVHSDSQPFVSRYAYNIICCLADLPRRSSIHVCALYPHLFLSPSVPPERQIGSLTRHAFDNRGRTFGVNIRQRRGCSIR